MLYLLFSKYVISYILRQHKYTIKCRNTSAAYVCTHTPSVAPMYVHCINLKLLPLMMNMGRVMMFQSHV